MILVCVYIHMYFQKVFCICSKQFPNINFWIFEKLYSCYFRAEIMKQMKNPRKWMRKMSFQVNSERVPRWTLSSYGGMSRHMHRLFYSYNTRDFFLFHTQKYVDLFHWTCLYMEDSSVCKWMIHAEGIQKWIFFKKVARLLLRSCELRCLLYVLW